MSNTYTYVDAMNRLIKKKVTTINTTRDAEGKIVETSETVVTEEYTYPRPIENSAHYGAGKDTGKVAW